MGDCKFIADVHLAKLAKYLRLLGLDTLYFTSIEDDALIALAKKEKRFILTKDKALCARCSRCFLVQAKEVKEQVKEIIAHFNLTKFHPFTRCLVDNSLLKRIEKEQILEKIPPKVRRWCKSFWHCPHCGRIYWQGSHYERMREFIDEVGAETP